MELEKFAIIEAVKAGSEKILFHLYENYRDEFVSWSIRNHQIDTDAAKDIFQEVIIAFYKAVKDNKTSSIESSIKTYLFSIGDNKIKNLLTRKKLEQKYLNDLVYESDNTIEWHYRNEHLVSFVKKLYQSIGLGCREVLKMYYENGFDMESIAVRMGYKNANVAKKKKYECIKMLEERIRQSPIASNFN